MLTKHPKSSHRAFNEREHRLLQSLIDGLPLAIVVQGDDGRALLCNPAFERFFLHPRHEVIGESVDDLLRIDESVGEETLLPSTHGGRWFRCRDGSLVEATESSFSLKLGPASRLEVRLFQTCVDSSAEQRLRESEERFRVLARSAFEGVMVIENDRIVEANSQLANLFGVPLSEVIGKSPWQAVHKKLQERARELMNTEYEQPHELQCFRVDGTPINVEVRGKSLHYRGRQARVTVVRDVTSRKQLEDDLRQAQKMEAIGQLAGGIAHDFNNLLTVIQGHSELLLTRVAEHGSLQRSLDEIHRAAKRAATLTGQLLTFSRKQKLEPERLDLSARIRKLEPMLRRLIREDIELRTELADGIPTIEIDGGQIEQVLLNLVINARDAMPGGGFLTVSADSVWVGRKASQGGLKAGRYVRLRVRDSGRGIDSVTKMQIFEPFFTTKKSGEGTGLGLATVYNIVKQYDGSVTVESKVGQGARFEILLPADTRKSGSVAEPEDELEPIPQKIQATALVVEDAPEIGLLVAEGLRLKGFKVLSAEDPETALEWASRQPIDILITDLVMPKMHGNTLADKIRELQPDIKVLVISGHVSANDRRTMGRPFLQKPFSMDELTLKVGEVLETVH